MAKAIEVRKPINIELIINKHEELEELKKSDKFNSFVFNEVLASIKDAIKNKSNEAKILNIVNMNYVLSIDKKEFKLVLMNMLEFYEKIEEYMVCKDINKLLKKVQKL